MFIDFESRYEGVMRNFPLKLIRHLQVPLLVFVSLVATGCGSSAESDWETHSHELISFELPEDWEAVPDRRGQLFAPADESYEKTQIEIRASRNPRIGPRQVRSTWLGMREAAERGGKLIDSSTSTVNGFERFELVQRAPAPSEELIPAEHQVAGDQTYHQVLMIDEQNLSITARLMVEEADYDAYLSVFRRTLDSIRPLGQGS